ncbi:MAG: hypothetical protein HN976_36060 [Lentisphaerae bacterium]|nr:hypothetical protein [Lentisphaerota bacterium]MBT7060565.1 hypothetical protein [Lentisphaerota bacterium]
MNRRRILAVVKGDIIALMVVLLLHSCLREWVFQSRIAVSLLAPSGGMATVHAALAAWFVALRFVLFVIAPPYAAFRIVSALVAVHGGEVKPDFTLL